MRNIGLALALASEVSGGRCIYNNWAPITGVYVCAGRLWWRQTRIGTLTHTHRCALLQGKIYTQTKFGDRTRGEERKRRSSFSLPLQSVPVRCCCCLILSRFHSCGKPEFGLLSLILNSFLLRSTRGQSFVCAGSDREHARHVAHVVLISLLRLSPAHAAAVAHCANWAWLLR